MKFNFCKYSLTSLIIQIFVLVILTIPKINTQSLNNNSVEKFKRNENIQLDIAIVTTLDGNLHGINKETGERLWTLDIDQGPIIKSSLFNVPKDEINQKKPIKEEKKHKNKGQKSMKNKNDKIYGKIEKEKHNKHNEDLVVRREDAIKEIYIPEPKEDGSIFVMKPGEDLHILPFSIKALIEQAPFAQNENIYLGSKTTHILGINPYDGKLTKSYSMDSSYALEQDDNEIHIGRIDYHLIIKDSLTGKIKWNVSYSEYTTANFDEQQAIEYTNDNKKKIQEYLAASANSQGDLIIHDKIKNKYTNYKFASPVLSTFGISSSSESKNKKLKLSKAKSIWAPEKIDQSTKKAFIGSIDGNLFALSSEKFPNFQANMNNDALRLDGISNYPTLPEKEEKDDRIYDENGEYHLKKENEVIEEVGEEYDSNLIYEYGKNKMEKGLSIGGNREKINSKECHYGSPYFPACLLGEQEYMEDYKVILTNRKEQCNENDQNDQYNNQQHGYQAGRHGINNERRMKISNIIKVAISTLLFIFISRYLIVNRMITLNKIEESPCKYKIKIMEKTEILNHIIKKLQKLKNSEDEEKEKILAINSVQEGIDEKDNFEFLEYSKENSNNNEIKDGDDVLENIKKVGDSLNENMSKSNTNSSSETTKTNNNENNENNDENSKIENTNDKKENNKNSNNELVYPLTIGSIVVTDDVLGYGSHGTVVYKGKFQGRSVAIKRLLIDFYDIAFQEVKLLQESDDHPNVIRYFAREQTERFMYIAIELCMASLHDIIEKSHIELYSKIRNQLDPVKLLYQIISGIQHLHSLKIVHRDIKPQNILIAAPKKNQNHPRILISDFGLCKKLDDNQSSFNNTIHTAAGTVGWRAPECLLLASTSSPNENFDSSSISSQNTNDSSYFKITNANVNVTIEDRSKIRITKAIDIFSAGCVFYYVLSNGQHPFGDRYYREANIINNRYNLTDSGFYISVEASDLIEHMIQLDYKKRPSAKSIMSHPYFWTPTQKLNFLQEASDRFEIEPRDPPSPLLQLLETNAKLVVSNDWYKVIDKALLNNLGKYRKYNGGSVRDLLRALRNKKHHYQDLPEYVKIALGPIPEGFLNYFTSRFPFLLLHIYYVIVNTKILKEDPIFESYLNSNPE